MLAVASGWTGQLLAQPLSCRPNLYMHTLNFKGSTCTSRVIPKKLHPVLHYLQQFWFTQWPFFAIAAMKLKM